MKSSMTILLCCFVLAACSSAKNTPLPRELENMDSIKPAMEKLEPEDRELATGYIMRHTVGAKMGAIFGGAEGPGIPEGMTIGKAIEEQRKFIADQEAEEQKQAALKVLLQAQREAAIKPMREAVTVTLVSKRINPEYGYSGILMDENLEVIFGYKNNTQKDISGVKGYVSVRDLFGDELSGFAISNDDTIPAGESITWTGSRSVKYAVGDNKDRKLAELDDSKYKVNWEPRMIVFADGTKLEVPTGSDG
ncbi:hypothetical protein [Novilysobacter antarcticus]|uniref:hypothetical protein n=1 Tax=Novilysobacter antarcticus TaxID=2862543 RepID=UPI001FEC4B92|nr:hypothetical protein [Lysobacter antarcticus]